MVYRVLLNDNVFVGYTVDAGYISPAENPLRYAVGSDITVDGNEIPVVSDTVDYIDRWSGRDETVVVTGTYAFVDADLTTLASGVTYVVAGTVTNRHLLSLSGPATLVVCDGATLVAEGGFTSAYAPAVTNALSIHGQAAGDGLLFAKDFRCVDVAIHGVTTVTDGIFDGTPVVLGGTVSANEISNETAVVVGGSVCVSRMEPTVYDSAERLVYEVRCPVPGAVGRVTVEGLEGYCTGDIFPVDGRICLYLPSGEYAFTVNGVRMWAQVVLSGTEAVRDDGGYLAYGRAGELLGAYSRLTNAIAAAAGGGRVELTNDCHEAGAVVLSDGTAVTLDGRGYRLTLTATDAGNPSVQICTNAALCLTNVILTRSAASRSAGLARVEDGGTLEMLDCAVTNFGVSAISSLITVANGGFRASGVTFAGNSGRALVDAAVRRADGRFALENWSAYGNACEALFRVDNLSGREDACEIGAGAQVGNVCSEADLAVGIGAACLHGDTPLTKIRLEGFAMQGDFLPSHLVYRGGGPKGQVSLDVSSPDGRRGSIIVSSALGVAVGPQGVSVVQSGCIVTADASGNLRLERSWARPFVVPLVSGGQTNFIQYASMAGAIASGASEVLLMSYADETFRTNTVTGDAAVPAYGTVSLGTVSLSVGGTERWTVPSPDPVTLNGDILVGTNGVLRIGNVAFAGGREIRLEKGARVVIDARPPRGSYLHVRFSDSALGDGAVAIASTCLTSAELMEVCDILNSGHLLVPAESLPAGMTGALRPISGEDLPQAVIDPESYFSFFVDAMTSLNGASGSTNATVYALAYTNETDGASMTRYSSKGRCIGIGGDKAAVALALRSRTVSEGASAGLRTTLDLAGSTLRIRKGSVLTLGDVNVTGVFALDVTDGGRLDLSGYAGESLTVSIVHGEKDGRLEIAAGDVRSKINLAGGQAGEIVVINGVTCWQLGVTYEYHQIENGKLHVKIFKNGKLVEEWDSEVIKDGKLVYTYTDPETGVKYDLNLYALYIDIETGKVHVAEGTKYLASDGTYKTLTNGARPPEDMRSNKDLTFTVVFPDGRSDQIHIMTPAQEKEAGIGGVEGVQIALLTVAGLIAAASVGVSIAEAMKALTEMTKDLGLVLGIAEIMFDVIRMVVNIVTTINDYKNNPLAYKGTSSDWSVYPVSEFRKVHLRCAAENYPHGDGKQEYAIAWRRTHTIGAETIPVGSFTILDGKGETINPFLQKMLFDYSTTTSKTIDAFNIAKTVLDIVVMVITEVARRLVGKPAGFLDPMTWASIISLAADKLSGLGLAIAITVWKGGFFEPPLDGSVTVPSGCDYNLRNLQFNGSKSEYGKPRLAPILVAKPGAFLEFSACQLNNFSYSSPSGLVYVSEGATLILKDFTSTGNAFTGIGGTAAVPPIIAARGSTVWVCGATDVSSIGAVGADLRIGYGPHGGKAALAAELSGSGSIRIEGATYYGLKIGSLQSPATSNGLDKIVSKSYSAWVKPAVSEDGKSSVWELRDGSLLKEFEPIKFAEDAPFSISVSQSSSGRSATLTGGLVVPTKRVRDAFPLEFRLISTDDLKQPFSDAGRSDYGVTVNAAGYFTNEVRNLQSTPTRHFRLKYRWRGAPDPVR